MYERVSLRGLEGWGEGGFGVGPPSSSQPSFLPGLGPEAGAGQEWRRRENCLF